VNLFLDFGTEFDRPCLDWDENFWIWDYLDMDKKEDED